MNLYLDTSVLVAALTEEDETSRLQRWLGEQEPGTLSISEWVVTEFSSALSVKLRRGDIEPDRRAHALEAFRQLSAESLAVASVTAIHFRAAARLADRARTGLRAGDALHLAIATELRAELYTLDRRLASAGIEVGVSTNLI